VKILAVCGSQRKNGNTATLINEACKSLPEDVEIDIVYLSDYNFEGCRGCEGCSKTYRCVLKDDMQSLYPKIVQADGLILGSPTLFYNVSAKVKAFIERLYPFELFDQNDRHVWTSGFEIFGLKYAVVIAVCEQLNEKDMGFTDEAMAMPLEALGFRIVEKVKVLNLFGKNEASENNQAKADVVKAAMKLYKTIRLVHQSKDGFQELIEKIGTTHT